MRMGEKCWMLSVAIETRKITMDDPCGPIKHLYKNTITFVLQQNSTENDSLLITMVT